MVYVYMVYPGHVQGSDPPNVIQGFIERTGPAVITRMSEFPATWIIDSAHFPGNTPPHLLGTCYDVS